LIPKKIHYCWFGETAKYPLILKCIASWRKYCPDFEIIEWNETNSDLSAPFVHLAYKNKKWAFVADYLRYKIIKKEGGLYLDTDVFLISNLDSFLCYDAFLCYEDPEKINAAVFGAVKNHPYLDLIINYYDSLIIDEKFDYTKHIIPRVFDNIYFEQKNQNIKVFSYDYFYPMPYKKRFDDFGSYLTSNTYGVHLWDASWRDKDATFYLKERFIIKSFKILFNHVFISPNPTKVYKYFRTVASFIFRKIFFIPNQ
jgi:mannosyltransferase OCH1-like enzyme